MGRYVKLPPSAVEKININGTPLSKKAPKHPDGWYLCLPAHCTSLWDREKYDNFEDAMEAAGGIILDENEAFESQRGNLTGRGDDIKNDHVMASGDGNANTQPETPPAEEGKKEEGESDTDPNPDTEGEYSDNPEESEEGGDA